MSNSSKETLGFQAEVKQLMHLVVHSLYSNKEIFLRELISNASDAADKLRFIGLSDAAVYEKDPDVKIRVSVDREAGTVTVSDNGIGMNRDEIISHLGTIAKSGTKEFLSNLSGDEAKDSHLIGQFGVGFYSAFIVADKVTVESRRAGAAAKDAVRWESCGDGEYSLEAIEKQQRGTDIILHIKDAEKEFLEDYRLRTIIAKYSDHISWPIVMKKIALPTAEGEEQVEAAVEEETVNRATALWTLPKKDIKDEEYQELYKHISHDFENPLVWSHNRVEGKHHYTSLLYIPAKAPFNMWDREQKHGMKLFVQRVFVMDDVEQFMPRYLRFVKGIIDSNDLPLNVSREILQSNALVDSIRGASVKKVLDVLAKIAKDDQDKYAQFWKAFGRVLKEGPVEDFSNRDKIAKLLRFSSTHTDNSQENVSLEDYISRMKDGQDKIFYITAESFAAAKDSAHLKIFRKKGIEVLLLCDQIDEWLVGHMPEFDGKQLQSVTKGELDLGEVEDEKQIEAKEQVAKDFESVLKQVKEVLGDDVKEVRVTHRLTDSPACVVADDLDMGRQMQRILEAAGQDAPKSPPILELNPEHALVLKLKAEQDDVRFAELSQVLFEQSLLAESGHLENPVAFVKRLNKLLAS